MRKILPTLRQSWLCLILALVILAVAAPALADKLNNARTGEELERRSGPGSKISEGPSREDRDADKAEIPADDDTTIWITRSGGEYRRFSNNPNDQGWWVDKDGHSRATFWNDIQTSCKPCQGLAERYNNAMKDLFYARRDVVEARETRDSRLKSLRQMLDQGKASRERADKEGRKSANLAADQDAYVAFTSKVTEQMDDINEAYAARVRHLEGEIARKENIAKLVANQLAECEKQCNVEEGKTGIVIGGSGGWVPANPPPGVQDPMALPFPWAGPYSTCFPCQKLADALNRLPRTAEEELRSIEYLRAAIRELDSGVTEKENQAANGDAIDFWDETPKYTREQYAEQKTQMEASIEEHQRKLQKITEYFNQVLGMLRECERTRCRGAGSSASSSTGGVLVPGASSGVSTELEHTVPITGTNPFDAKEIGRIPSMVSSGSSASSSSGSSSGSGGSSASSSSGSSSGSSGSSASSSSGASSGSSGGTPPLQISTFGSFSFSHTVGSSPCPQSAGTVVINSNNGHPLNITGISVSGTLSSKLNVSPNGAPSVALQLQGQFNCSSPANGTFTGNVTGTVTDTVTGETAPVTVSASGSVSG